MLRSAETIERIDGRIEGSFDAADGWSAMPIDPTTRQLRIFLGDAVSGPLAWMFNGTPVASQWPPQPHLHRSPTFRIALGKQPRQMLLNNSWYGEGDYFLLDANKVYTDPNGIEGFQTLLIFADRRGMHPVRRAAAAPSAEALLAENEAKFTSFAGCLPALLTRNEDAVAGVAITTHERHYQGGQARGSLHETASWHRLSDGSRFAAVFMGDAATGPVVVLSENVAGAVESPAGRCAGDMLRVIAGGSCTIGDQRYDAGAFVALEAGAPIGAVVHGAEGSRQLVMVCDRRCWVPVDDSGRPVESARGGEVAQLLARYTAAQA